MYSLGIDIGYHAVKCALLDPQGAVIHTQYLPHGGDVSSRLDLLLHRLLRLPEAGGELCAAVTGCGGPFLAEAADVRRVNEVAALVEGALALDPACASILEMGGQTAKFVTGFSREDRTRVRVSMTSNCSSGTGSFLEEQASRLGVGIGDYADLAAGASSIPRIAGRCSVFAKTDIIHHQQEGVPAADILAGLAHAVVRNYRSAVVRGLPRTPPLLFVGGVSRNRAITEAMRSVLKLAPEDLRVHEHSSLAGAVGAAVLAAREGLPLRLGETARRLGRSHAVNLYLREGVRLEPLDGFGEGDAPGKHECAPLSGNGPTACWLGVDVGSTSTNLVLADAGDDILAYRYLRTAGDPVAAVRLGLAELRREFGDAIRIAGVGATGSGRYMTGRLVGADVVRDEITAQARAATALDPAVDTIFEIGGQDSKFIALEGGVVTDFQMNKICAAGTGSFIEEQARKLGIPLDEFGADALAAQSPTGLGERCTVFMESSVAAHLAHGADPGDLAAGLCYSIVKNYLNRVVGKKRIGNRIFLQGGIAHNQGVVNALRAATGKEVTVPPFFSVTGAYGAAILAREGMEAEGRTATRFRGFHPRPDEEPAHGPAPDRTAESTFNRQVRDFIFAGYDGVLDPAKKTVGIPRALFTYGMFPLFFPFFRELGCNVLLSEPTSEETIRLAQEYALDETCYPVKLINGHVAELVGKGVDYLFFPDLHTVFHPGSWVRRDYGCAYMQLAFKIVNKAMDLQGRGIRLLAPTIAFSRGREFMHGQFMKMGRELGADKERTGRALQKAMQAFGDFEKRIGERAQRTVAELPEDEKAFVLISKIYGVADPVLNLGIPDKLAELGYRTLPFYDLPEADVSREHPNMYWPFGQHILEAARLAAGHPNLYAVFLTHHGCGPDTVTAHYFKEIMGDKPYLTIEVDEHSSAVGVVTRVEAFVNSLGTARARKAGSLETYARAASGKAAAVEDTAKLPTSGTILLPDIRPYSRLACGAMRALGVDAATLDETCAASIDRGRRHTVTNEYFSLAALLGDLLETVHGRGDSADGLCLLLPQNEGAEVDGQYARFVRTKLDESGFGRTGIVSPFMEDLLDMPEDRVRSMFLCLLAGDLVLLAPRESRKELLGTLEEMARKDILTLAALVSIARYVRTLAEKHTGGKRILALGEPLVLFNDLLNDDTFKTLEDKGHRVIYAPLSECMWSFWRDHALLAGDDRTEARRRLLDEFRDMIREIGRKLGEQSPFEPDPEALMAKADEILGHYAGAFGRYRSAKPMGALPRADGVISVTSMYENTGISLGILRNGDTARPLLTLTFDGTRNENDRIKTESFVHYL